MLCDYPGKNNKMGGTVGKNDALRIGKGIKNIERITLKNTAGLSKPVKIKTGIPAKITKVGEEGFYDLIEQMPVEGGAGFEDKTPKARVWAEEPTQDEPDPLPQAFEINSNEDLEEDLIVYIYRLSNSESIKNQWFFDSASSPSDSTDPKTDKSNTTIKGKIQFRNDITFERQGDASFIVNINDLGDVTNGCVAYGGNEQADGSEEGFQRHYKFIFDVKSPQAGYLIPQTAAGIESDAETLNNLNDLWIGFKHRFGGQTMEIFHNVLTSALRSDTDYKFPSTPAGGTLGRFFVSATSGGMVNVPVDVDRTGHILTIDGNDSTIITPPEETNISQSAGGAPTSGTLYNVPIPQVTNLTTLAGVDTNTLNGANALIYEADTPAGAAIDIGFTSSIHVSFFADATEYNGAGTGGNDTDIRFHLAKTLDGKDISLRGFLDENKLNDTDTVTDIDSVELKCEIQTVPVPDNTSFDVRVTLVAGPNGVGNPGDRFIRFDNDGEYDVTVFLIYEADKVDFDANDALTFVATNTETVASFEANTLSGADVSFTFDFPDNKSGSNLIARAFLEFQRTAANPQPLAGQKGVCTISNNGNLCDDVEAIAGNAATGTMDVANNTYSPDGTPGTTINGVDFTQLDNPIVCTFTILKGGNPTTEFSLAAVTSNFQVFSGSQEVRVSTNNFEFDNTAVLITNPINGTDGYIFTINFMETAFLNDGQEYLVKATTVGVSDSPNTDTFSFSTEGSIFPATDFFGTNSQDDPFPWSDDFGGPGEFDSDTIDGVKYSKRWTTTINTIDVSISGGAIVLIENSGTGSHDYTATLNKAMTIAGDFEVSLSYANFAGTFGGGGFVRAAFLQITIGGTKYGISRTKGEQGITDGIIVENPGIVLKDGEGGTGGTMTMKRVGNTLSFLSDATDLGTNVIVSGSLTDSKINAVANTSSDFVSNLPEYEIKVADSTGNLINYFSPNEDRWNDIILSGTPYQLVNTATNNLEQICESSPAVRTIKAENRFNDGFNPNITTSTWKFDLAMTNISFSGNATETQFLEVRNASLDDMEMGYRHNGTEQQLFAFAGFSDILSEPSSATSNTVTIERGDFVLSDSFSGVLPDSTTFEGPIFSARFPISGNSANATITGGAISTSITASSTDWGVEQTGLSISGDFELTVSFSNVNLAASGILRSPNFNIVIDGETFFIIRALNENGAVNGYYWERSSTGVLGFIANQPDSSNTLTFKRTSGTLELQIGGVTQSGGSFTKTGDLTLVRFNVAALPGSNPTTFTCDITDYKAVDGTDTNLTVEKVLFKENETLKTAFDDGGLDVEEINIITTTTAIPAFNGIFPSINVEAPTGTQFTFDPDL